MLNYYRCICFVGGNLKYGYRLINGMYGYLLRKYRSFHRFNDIFKPMRRNFNFTSLLFVVLLVFVEWIKHTPTILHIYAHQIYPHLMRRVHAFSSFFSVPLYDLFIPIMIGLLLWLLIRLCIGRNRGSTLYTLFYTLSTLYISFYLLWGYNYYLPTFYERNKLEVAAYDEEQFGLFLNEYIKNINADFCTMKEIEEASVQFNPLEGFEELSKRYQIHQLPSGSIVKSSLHSRLYASMGVRGYYAPFFAESIVNSNNLPHQRVATQVHELAHLVGVTSEAEANLYTYLICTESTDKAIRFSGYYSVLPYVLGTARRNSSEDQFKEILSQLSPELLTLYRATSLHWEGLYSSRLGAIQNRVYDLYLRGNNISEGRKDYAGVLKMIISIRQDIAAKAQ